MAASTAITKKQTPLLKGDDGVVQTLLKMEFLALRDAKDPRIKAKVRELKGATSTKTIKNIYDWVVENYKYKSDPQTEEHVTAPVHLLNNCDRFFGCKHVDCDDYSTLLTAMLIAAGFHVAFRVLSWRAKSFTHVYILVHLPEYDGWTPVDAVMGKTGLYNEKTRDAHLRTLTLPIGEVTQMLEKETEPLSEHFINGMNPEITALAGDPPQRRDILGGIIGGITQGKGAVDILKGAGTEVCKDMADQYIKEKEQAIMFAVGGGIAAGLIVGTGVTWLVMRK
jgi:Transglutaminase-like superfamily